MPIPIQCPECHRKYRLDDDMAGQSVRCNECSAVLSVPERRSHRSNRSSRSSGSYSGLPRRSARRSPLIEVPPVVPTVLLVAFGCTAFIGIAWMVISRATAEKPGEVPVVETDESLLPEGDGGPTKVQSTDKIANKNDLSELQSGPCILARYSAFDGKKEEMPAAAGRALWDLPFAKANDLIVDPFKQWITIPVRGPRDNVDAEAVQIELENEGFTILLARHYPDGVPQDAQK